MNELERMKETLISATQAQLANLSEANAKELGCAIDMIKDLAETMYYCSIIEAMDEAGEEREPTYYYHERKMRKRPYYPERDMDREYDRLYYPDYQNEDNNKYRDPWEGHSPEKRRTYMESRMSHTDKAMHLKDLENYLQELSSDITEMIRDASQEEKQLLQRKLNVLANKVMQVNDN